MGVPGHHRTAGHPDPPFANSDVRYNAGDYTWYLTGGHWRYHEATLAGFDDEWSGTYAVSGDRITFSVDQGDPNCLGARWTARWSLVGGSSLTFTDTISTQTRACAPQAIGDAWMRTVFALHPWQRVS